MTYLNISRLMPAYTVYQAFYSLVHYLTQPTSPRIIYSYMMYIITSITHSVSYFVALSLTILSIMFTGLHNTDSVCNEMTETEYQQTAPSGGSNPEEDPNPKNSRTNSKRYWKARATMHAEVDNGEHTTNPEILVLRHLASDNPTDLKVLNSILSIHGICLTEEEFSILEGITPVTLPFPFPPRDKLVLETVGSYASNSIKVPGCYIFTLQEDGQQYVGRSIALGRRIRVYVESKKVMDSGRPIVRALKKWGPANFGLQVYVLDPSLFNSDTTSEYIMKMGVALEQYLILKLKPVFNEVLVVDRAPSKYILEQNHNSVPVYVYNLDMTQLLFISPSTKALMEDLNISDKPIRNTKNKNVPIYGKYVLSKEQLPTATLALMSKDDIQQDIYRLSINSKGSLHAVTLIDLQSPDRTQYRFDSKTLAYKFTQTKGRPFRREHMLTLPATRNGWLLELTKSID